MKRVNLHNLRCFIMHNPGATVADYAKEIREDKLYLKLIGEAYDSIRTTR